MPNTINLEVNMDDPAMSELVTLMKQLQANDSKPPNFKPKKLKKEQSKATKVAKMKLNKNCNDIGEQFVKTAKNIKPSTARGYWSKTKTLYNRYTGKIWDGCSFDWLNDTDDVLKFVANHKAWNKTSKWCYINSVTSILLRIEGYEDAYKIYSEANKKGFNEYVTIRENNVLNKQQLANIVNWEQVMGAKAPTDLKGELIFELMRWIPRRSGTYRQLRWRSAEGKGNYFLIQDGKVIKMTLNSYKTFKTYGQFNIAVPKHLSDIILNYIKAMDIKDGGYLLSKSQSQSQFSSWTTNTMARIFNNKRMGTTLFRISYASYMTKKLKSVKEQKAVASNLGHSLEQLRLYAKIDL